MARTGFVAELKVTGLILLCGIGTAASFTPTTGVFSATTAIALTPANIDGAPGNGVYSPGQLAAYIRER